jgi:electron transport complex protein RnfG
MSKKELIMPPLVLTIICLVVTAALVFTYQFTKPYIEAATAAAANAARSEVFPGEFTFEEQDSAALNMEGLVDLYLAKDAAGNEVGCVITAAAKGFNGLVNVMVGIDSEGAITGVKLMDHGETPGLGTKTGEPDFTSQFQGKTVDSLNEVVSISGATITSTAFRNAVDIAMAAYQAVAGGAN